MFSAAGIGSEGKDPADILAGAGCVAWGQALQSSVSWLSERVPRAQWGFLGLVGTCGIASVFPRDSLAPAIQTSPSGNTRVIFLQRYRCVFVQPSGWVLAEDRRGGGNRESCVLVLAGSLLSELVPA